MWLPSIFANLLTDARETNLSLFLTNWKSQFFLKASFEETSLIFQGLESRAPCESLDTWQKFWFLFNNFATMSPKTLQSIERIVTVTIYWNLSHISDQSSPWKPDGRLDALVLFISYFNYAKILKRVENNFVDVLNWILDRSPEENHKHLFERTLQMHKSLLTLWDEDVDVFRSHPSPSATRPDPDQIQTPASDRVNDRLDPDTPWLQAVNSWLSPFGQQVSFSSNLDFKYRYYTRGEGCMVQYALLKKKTFLKRNNYL